MESYLYFHALKEMFRIRRIIPWILIALFIGLMGLAWHDVVPDATLDQQYGDVSSMLIFRMVALASAIYTTSIISQEVEQKTIVYLLTRPVARWKLLSMRFLASVTTVAFIGIFAAVVLSAFVYRGNIAGNPLLGHDILAIVVGSLCYGSLFLLFSLLSNRAMILCIIFAFGWEVPVANLPGDLSYLTIFSYVQAIAQHPETSGGPKAALLTGQMGSTSISPSVGLQVMVITAVALVGLGLWWFTHFEYIPREDVE